MIPRSRLLHSVLQVSKWSNLNMQMRHYLITYATITKNYIKISSSITPIKM